MKTFSHIPYGILTEWDAPMGGVDAMAREDYAWEVCIVLI
jgi:hypothetical protein